MNSSQIAVDSTHSADSVDSAEEGVTYRWGVRRPGRDRWHNADGSLINRGRARPSPLEDPVATFSPASGDHGRPGEVGPVAGGDGGRLRVGGLAPVPEEQMVEPDEQPFTITGSGQVDGAPVLKGVTFYGREFLVRGNSNEDSGDSTTAGEDSEDTEAYDTTSSDSSEVVGFWKYGEWQPRHRTPEELRAHRGGGGPRRQQRRQERVQLYLRGEWKPRWLQEYVIQKQQRDDKARAAQDVLPASESPVAQQSVAPPQPEVETEGDSLEQPRQPPKAWTFSSDSMCPSSSSSCPASASWSSNWTWPTNWTSSSSWWSSWSNEWQWGEWQEPEQQVEEWPWPGETSSSSSTSSTTTWFSPNFGLFPVVRELEEGEMEETWLMQLTNSERATLQESGVPPATVARLDSMLDTMDRQQREGRGAEGRWALGCFLARASEGAEALDSVLGVLQRRLQPRGYFPIRRVPANEQMRWSLFQWARNHRDVVLGTLERHLDVGLVPGDSELPAGEGSMAASSTGPGEEEASEVATEAAPSTPREAVSLSPTSSAREGFGRDGGVASSSSSSSDKTSDFAYNSDGELVSVHTADGEDDAAEPRGPPPPQPVFPASHGPVGSLSSALAGGLHGVWHEPEEVAVSTMDAARGDSAGSEAVVPSAAVETTSASTTSSLAGSTTATSSSMGSLCAPPHRTSTPSSSTSTTTSK